MIIFLYGDQKDTVKKKKKRGKKYSANVLPLPWETATQRTQKFSEERKRIYTCFSSHLHIFFSTSMSPYFSGFFDLLEV